MKLDIVKSGNMVGGRQGWAYVCNSGKFPVLMVDLKKPQDYDEYKTYGKVRVAYAHRGEESRITATLAWNKGRWELASGGCCLSASFGVADAIELLENANAPFVKEGSIVAVGMYGDTAILGMFKVGKFDRNCVTVSTLEPLTDEEMKAWEQDAIKWCMR